MTTVEEMYKSFGVLADAKDDAKEHEDAYTVLLSGVKGGESEKRLACQFIPRFFKHFPTLADQAIDAQLDLCEDENTNICKQAIKELPVFCRDMPQHLGRISDILTQLLQAPDPAEVSVTTQALTTLLKSDPKGALSGLFCQILEGEEIVRENAIKFLKTKLPGLIKADVFDKEVEEYLVAECKKVLSDVSGPEFVSFMLILQTCPSMQTLQGRQSLVEISIEQAELDQPFVATDPDCVDKLIACIRQALPLFSKNVQTTAFVSYMCDHVVSVMSDVIAHPVEGEEEEKVKKNNEDLQIEVMKLFAEMALHCGDLDNVEGKIENVYNSLVSYMPLPPVSDESENGAENGEGDAGPDLQFSRAECLMFAFHQLARKQPEFLSAEENADRLKDFRLRLQYFARGLQIYIKQLRAALQGKTGDALKEDDSKKMVIALKITSNINLLIKDLFHNPPSYKQVIGLSWKPIQKATSPTAVSPGNKRSNINPISFDKGGDPKKARSKSSDSSTGSGKMYSDRQMYSPPSGKWSDKAGEYQSGEGNGFRGGRGRGGYRGRGRGRGNYRGGYNNNRW